MSATDSLPVPLFLDGPAGRLFCVYRSAASQRLSRRALLVLPAFAEEMNKTRRMVSLLAAELQHRGVDSLVPDLTGTGDSEGEFRDTRLDVWRGDIAACTSWLGAQGVETLDVLAIRFGARLIGQLDLDAAPRLGRLVLWQPIASGRLLVNQFLRLRFAAALVAGAERTESMALRDALRREGLLEIAGYELSEPLASSLETLELRAQPAQRFEHTVWFEVASGDSAEISPAAARIAADWRDAGTRLGIAAVHGDPFWATTEIATLPNLLAATLAELGEETLAA